MIGGEEGEGERKAGEGGQNCKEWWLVSLQKTLFSLSWPVKPEKKGVDGREERMFNVRTNSLTSQVNSGERWV